MKRTKSSTQFLWSLNKNPNWRGYCILNYTLALGLPLLCTSYLAIQTTIGLGVLLIIHCCLQYLDNTASKFLHLFWVVV